MSFSKIPGQGRAIALLRKDLQAGRLAESYLFLGIDGSGRRETALEFAKLINCESRMTLGDPDACDACDSCRKIDAATHPDVFVLDFETQAKILDLDDEQAGKQKELRIDSVRRLIQMSQTTPLEGVKKVLLVDGAEFLNPEASNALLKSLEESTASAHWILLATSLERVLPTIQSRCRKVSFAPIDLESVKIGKAGGSAPEEPDPFVDKILEGVETKRMDPVGLSMEIFADKKKGGARQRADKILKQLALQISGRLYESPNLSQAEMLEDIFEAQDEIRRNVSPQLVMDSLLFTFQSKI